MNIIAYKKYAIKYNIKYAIDFIKILAFIKKWFLLCTLIIINKLRFFFQAFFFSS